MTVKQKGFPLGTLVGLAGLGLAAAAISAAWLLAAARGPEPAPTPANTPERIDTFTLKDTNGKGVSLADFRDKKAVVVVFVGTECPLVNLYLGRLAELNEEFSPKGVQFLAVNSN